MIAGFETEPANAISVLQHEHTVTIENRDNGTRSARSETSFSDAQFAVKCFTERHGTLLREFNGAEHFYGLNRTGDGLLGARCCNGNLLTHAAEFDLKVKGAFTSGEIDLLNRVGNAIQMRHDVILTGRQSLKFVLAAVVSIDSAFQLEDRDQNVVNWLAALAQRDCAAQRRRSPC